MNKYFKNDLFDMIESENIISVFHRADKKPENFIRIALNEKHMKLDVYAKAEFTIHHACLFHLAPNGNVYRYDLEPGDTQKSFYAAIDSDCLMTVVLDDPKYPLEKLFMFNSCEKFLAILKSDDSTIFVLYDGTADNVGYGYFLEKNGYPNLYPVLMELFDISQPVCEEENDTVSDEK
jgi:hypothetical protein